MKIAYIGKEYFKSFDLWINKYGPWAYECILHVSIGGDYLYHGDRAPGIFFTPEKYVYFSDSVSGSPAHPYIYNTTKLPVEEWINIEITQTLIEEKV